MGSSKGMETVGEQFIWLLTRWWFWLAFVVGMGLHWYLFRQRTYKVVGGSLFVRHGRLGRWLNVEDHMKVHK